MRLSEVDNSTVRKLKGYKNLEGTVMNRSTRTLKNKSNMASNFKIREKMNFTTLEKKDAYSCMY